MGDADSVNWVGRAVYIAIADEVKAMIDAAGDSCFVLVMQRAWNSAYESKETSPRAYSPAAAEHCILTLVSHPCAS